MVFVCIVKFLSCIKKYLFFTPEILYILVKYDVIYGIYFI